MALLLDSLRIENYRPFRKLEIEGLRRATLIVGKNNSGKSSVLEAVSLFASRGDTEVIVSILESHDETRMGSADDPRSRFSALQQLFNGREVGKFFDVIIRIGAIGADGLRMRIEPATEDPSFLTLPRWPGAGMISLVSTYGEISRRLPINIEWERSSSLMQDESRTIRNAHVPPNGLSSDRIAELWDRIALSNLEDDVIAALRIISPEIERISFIGEAPRRIPVARLRSEARPVPLRSLGDGVNRMLGIALSLVEARDGVLLLDEIENGIHFSAQKRLWELILQSARRLNAQVFATTHSWDCIEAFQSAAAEDEADDAGLVRLDTRQGSIEPVMISEHALSIVTRDQIEVR